MAEDLMRKHCSGEAFRNQGKSIFLIRSDVILPLVRGVVANGGFVEEKSRYGVGQGFFLGFLEFPIGLTANGEEASALKVCVRLRPRGYVEVSTAYPVKAGKGSLNFEFETIFSRQFCI